METMGKFNYYKSLLIRYQNMRFGLLKFSAFSILLVMLGYSESQEWLDIMKNILFVFTSLFVFRWIDDAASFYIDQKEHSDRFYIFPEHRKYFFFLGGIFYLVYQVGLFVISYYLATVVFGLFLISSILYILFYKYKNVMFFIPLLKYPILIWCISRFSFAEEVLLLALGSFFLILTFDVFQKEQKDIKGLILKSILLLIAGLLVLQPWLERTNLLLDIVFILIPFLLLINSKNKYIPYILLLFFSVSHLLDILN